MNYNTSIAFSNRKEGFEPEKTPFKFPTINETYIKIFAVATSAACGALVLFLRHL